MKKNKLKELIQYFRIRKFVDNIDISDLSNIKNDIKSFKNIPNFTKKRKNFLTKHKDILIKKPFQLNNSNQNMQVSAMNGGTTFIESLRRSLRGQYSDVMNKLDNLKPKLNNKAFTDTIFLFNKYIARTSYMYPSNWIIRASFLIMLFHSIYTVKIQQDAIIQDLITFYDFFHSTLN